MTSFETPFGVILFVSVAMSIAAAIDGWKLKVPNWITYPFALSGLAYHVITGGFSGFTTSLLGFAVGLGLLLIPYVIGGMGAGDVKLFAGVGSWMGVAFTFKAFLVSTVVGGVLALAMIAYRALRGRDWGIWSKSVERFQLVATEIVTIRNPNHLAELAAARKPTAMLLPYGIPLAIGTISYFGYLYTMGLL